MNSKFEKFNFSKIFKIITFFRLRLRTLSGVSTPMKPIDALILLDGTVFDIFSSGNDLKLKFERMEHLQISISKP